MIQACLMLSPDIVKLPVKNIWIDYDKEADALYLSFRKPQRAKKTVEPEYRSFQMTKLCGVCGYWLYFYIELRIVFMRYPRIIADRHFRGCQYE